LHYLLSCPTRRSSDLQKKMWQRAQDKSYQRVRILIHFAKEGDLNQETINQEALEITGGTIQRAAYGIRLLDYVTDKAKATLLLKDRKSTRLNSSHVSI